MTNTFESLAIERDEIKAQVRAEGLSTPSNEALSIQRSANAVVTRFSNFLSNVGKKFNFGSETAGVQKYNLSTADYKLLSSLEKALAKGDYIDLAALKVQVVPGLSVKWLPLLDSWDPTVRFAVDFYDDYLLPFQKFLALGVSDPEKFTTLGSVSKVTQVDLDGYVGALSEGLKGNTKINIRTYSECADRNADTITAFRRSLDYCAALDKGNPALVREAIKRCSESIITISEQINDANLPYRLNAKTISDLTDIVYQMAKMSELYAVVVTYVSSQQVAMEGAAKKLISAVR